MRVYPSLSPNSNEAEAKMEPISMYKFARSYVKNNPSESLQDIILSLKETVRHKKAGVKCIICGNPIWAIGSAIVGFLTEILDIIQNSLQSLAITGFKILEVTLQCYQIQSPCGSIFHIASKTTVFRGYIPNSPQFLSKQTQYSCGVSNLDFRRIMQF